MTRSHRYCCGRSPRVTERRNPGRNGPEWKSKTYITEAEIGDDNLSIFEEDLLDCDFEDDPYSEHVTRVVVSIMDIARPAKKGHLRNNLKASNVHTFSVADYFVPLDDEEFEIWDDSEFWEDDWEEIHDEKRVAERVSYASALRGNGG
ncbi:hypothetical protein GALMADRAFT_241468 [Galerina marginata CBS 339.88]|uniref:Uncharacterized protein n=1 Tax=Galerina marginata (strain CBS 339.88) TaxID=685588 RepID=A0A067TCJ1_GALM3|nr:hypothetical protein GALMADRAFT_241468 [Galerina marginata CBS 339.88]